MGAHGHSDSHNHAVNEKATRNMIVFTLALFFVLTVVGHYFLVASQEHEETPGITGTHGGGETEH